MVQRLTFLSLVLTSLMIASCHKSNTGGNSTQLVGNYTLLYLTLQAQSISEESGGGQTQKTVTYTNYKTTQNSGTVSFSTDSIFSKGVGYTINTTTNSYVYQNGVLSDSISLPFSLTYPPSNSTTKYDVIGQDSILFHGGYLMTGLGGSTTVAPPSGGRFSFKGDTLFLISKVQQTNPSQNSGGVTVSSSASGIATIALLKQ